MEISPFSCAVALYLAGNCSQRTSQHCQGRLHSARLYWYPNSKLLSIVHELMQKMTIVILSKTFFVLPSSSILPLFHSFLSCCIFLINFQVPTPTHAATAIRDGATLYTPCLLSYHLHSSCMKLVSNVIPCTLACFGGIQYDRWNHTGMHNAVLMYAKPWLDKITCHTKCMSRMLHTVL